MQSVVPILRQSPKDPHLKEKLLKTQDNKHKMVYRLITQFLITKGLKLEHVTSFIASLTIYRDQQYCSGQFKD